MRSGDEGYKQRSHIIDLSGQGSVLARDRIIEQCGASPAKQNSANQTRLTEYDVLNICLIIIN